MADNWRALALGARRIPDDPAQDPVVQALGGALGLDQDSLAARMQRLSALQRQQFEGAGGPGPPGSEQANLGLDIAGKLTDLAGVIKIVKSNPGRYDALDDGTRVGSFVLANDFEKGEKFPFIDIASVNPEFRRQGIARSAYDFIENDIGRKLFPSPLGLSEEATNLWKKRLSDLSAAEVDELLAESRRTGLGYGISAKHIDERLAPFMERER